MVALQSCDGDAYFFEIRDGLNQHMLCVSGLRRADPSSIASLPWGECEQSSMYTLINKINSWAMKCSEMGTTSPPPDQKNRDSTPTEPQLQSSTTQPKQVQLRCEKLPDNGQSLLYLHLFLFQCLGDHIDGVSRGNAARVSALLIRGSSPPPFVLFNFDHGSSAVEKKARCPSSTPNFSDQ